MNTIEKVKQSLNNHIKKKRYKIQSDEVFARDVT